jgi:hypothetical protein
MNVHVIETQAFWRRYYLKEEREKRLKNKRLKNCPRKHKIYIYTVKIIGRWMSM